jgi:hypothetical protein
MQSKMIPTGIRKLWPSKAREQPGQRPQADVVAAESLVPIEDTSPYDIFLVGFPKSGNTWLQNLVGGVAFGVLAEFAPPRLVHLDLVPDVHQKKFYKRYSETMFFKSHHLPREEYRRVIYLVRDGRDAMVSYYQMRKTRKGDIDFLDMVQTGQNVFPCKWHEHVQAWLKNPFKAELLMMKYEEMKSDIISQLERLCQFSGLQRPRQHLELVAASCSFENLQTREKRMGRTVDRPWKDEGLFFRRGEVGSYRDEMPPNVQQAFLAEAAPTLCELGYVSP